MASTSIRGAFGKCVESGIAGFSMVVTLSALTGATKGDSTRVVPKSPLIHIWSFGQNASSGIRKLDSQVPDRLRENATGHSLWQALARLLALL